MYYGCSMCVRVHTQKKTRIRIWYNSDIVPKAFKVMRNWIKAGRHNLNELKSGAPENAGKRVVLNEYQLVFSHSSSKAHLYKISLQMKNDSKNWSKIMRVKWAKGMDAVALNALAPFFECGGHRQNNVNCN